MAFDPRINDSLLPKHSVAKWVRAATTPFGAITGYDSSMECPTAKIAITDHVAAIVDHWHLCEECLFISPTRCILRSFSDELTWNNSLTKNWEANPSRCVRSIELRDSETLEGLSSTFAKVLATDEQQTRSRLAAQRQEGRQP